MNRWIALLVLVGMSGPVMALTPWAPAAKSAYVNRCAMSMAQQGMPPEQAKRFCLCAADGMEREFGMEGHKEMIAAQPSSTGSAADRKLYVVMEGCSVEISK